MKRSKHSLSHYVLSTFNMGQLIPVGWYDVLPGDSVRQQSSMLIRVSPLVTPVMHPVSVRLHHWYVPTRIIWDEFEPFITGGTDGDGDGAIYPASTWGNVPAGSLPDYLGVPPGSYSPSLSLSKLPMRTYNKIFNENYRDQDLVSEVGEDDYAVQNIAWEKDAFTAARPWTQKGPTVTLPLGTSAPVVPDSGASFPTFTDGMVSGIGLSGTSPSGGATTNWSDGTNTVSAGFPGRLLWGSTGLMADLSNATAADVNSLRLAMALQRWQEARAQFGSRYTEYLRYLGVRSSDARLQRPEYLGGGRATISFSEVLNTGGQDDGADVPTGNLSGHGISAMRTRPFVRFFEEHGIVMTLASIRPRSMYVSGLDRQWSKRTREDYFQRELEQIGQQEVYNRELRASHAARDDVFGWQDRYYEYRHRPSYVTGDFRSTLSDWHFGRIFGGDPALNADFIECDPGVRPFADQTAGAHHMWAMVSHSIQARRMVGTRTIGRIL